MLRPIRWRLGAALAVAGSLFAAPVADAQSRLASTLDLSHINRDDRRCATVMRPESQREAALAQIRPHLDRVRASRLSGRVNLLIPTAYHIITSSSGAGDVTDQQIRDQHDVLNDAFAPWGIQFDSVLVQRVANDTWYNNFEANDTAAKTALAVDPTTTLNMYFAPIGALGYAFLPDVFPDGDPRWGVVNTTRSIPGVGGPPYNLGDTAVHEVGHAFGLVHTFSGGCHADSACETQGDFVCDTPAEASPYFGSCDTSRDTCPDGEGNDPVKNFMDYSDDICMDRFTQGQSDLMFASLQAFKPTLYEGAIAAGVIVDDRLAFGTAFVGFPVTETLSILNSTEGDVEVSALRLPDGFSSDFSGPVTLDDGEMLEVAVTFSPNTAGTFDNTLVVETSFSDTPDYVVALTAEGAFAPDISDPTGVEAASLPGLVSTARFTFTNEGLGDLTWSIDGFDGARDTPHERGGTAAWISAVAPGSGTLLPGEEATVNVLLSATELEVGTYTSVLIVRSNDPDEQEKEVPVSLVVNNSEAPAAPMLTEPESGAMFEPVPGASTVQVSLAWAAVEAADSYDIEIATDAEFSDVVDSAEDFAGTSGITEPLGVDVYYWHVRSNGAAASSPWSATRTFEVVRGTATDEQAPEQTALATALIGAFPNPFAHEATVRFAVADAAEIALVVYDVLGKEVARLAEGEYPAGEHEATFRADGLAPGVYLVHFAADEQVQTRQVMIVR